MRITMAIGVDLFSGAGGLSLGAVMAGIEVRLAVEKDRCAAETYRRNHPDYFAVYVGIKQTNINNTDLERLSNHATLIINEHLLSMFVVSNMLSSIYQTFGDQLNNYSKEIKDYYVNVFSKCVAQAGYEGVVGSGSDGIEGRDLIRQMITIVEAMDKECKKYCNRLALNRDMSEPYTGALADFIDFVSPVIIGLKKFRYFHKVNLFMS